MSETAVTLRVLGPLGATVAGQHADLGGPRPRAVVARLAVAGGQVVSTDRLVEDLWDAEVPAKALAALQVHVSGLRRVLEPARVRRSPATVLVSAAPGYALRLPVDAVDAWRFEALVRAAGDAPGPAERHDLLTRALGQWTGPAYAEVADHDWARPEIARLDELRLGALEARAEAGLALGRAAGVVPELERLLHDHPAREEAVRLLALALYRTGRQGDALAVLRRTRDHLAGELGVDPGPALRQLEGDILAQSPQLDRQPVAATPAAPRTAEHPPPPSLVPRATALGRAAELATIHAAAQEARQGARIVWVAADAGAGKTTLVEAAAEGLRAEGWQVAWGRCPEVDGAPPGWAWSEVMQALGPDTTPDTTPDTRSTAEPNPFWLARAITGVLAGRGPAGQLVVLDDAHRADGLTLQVLRQVIGSMPRSPLLVVATFRPSETGDEFAVTRGALVPATAADLRLQGLGPAAVAVLAAEYGLPDAGDDVAALLTDRTGGNPLFVRELARLVASEGVSSARTAVPEGVREVLRRRTGRLPDPVRAVLRQAAVLGRTVDVDVLAELAGRDPGDLADALETAVVAGLLDEPHPGLVRFTHALIRDTLYEDTPLLRRSRLHAAALRVLEEQGADAATLAHHAVASAGPATAAAAIPYVVRAAREAEAVGAHGEAKRQWRSAIDLFELGHRRSGVPVDADPEFIRHLVPAITASARAGDVAGARALFVRAVIAAEALADPELTIAALIAWDAPMVWTTREGAAERRVLAAIHASLDRELTVPQRIWVLIALFRETEGVDVETAWRATAEAAGLARGVRDRGEPDGDRLLAAALNAFAHARLGPDHAAARAAAAEELLDLATRADLADFAAVAHWFLFMDAAAVTDLTSAFSHVAEAVKLCGTGELGTLLSILEIFSGLVDLMAGRYQQGVARYERVGRALTEHGAQNSRLTAMIGRVGAGLAQGDLSASVPELEAIDRARPGLVVAPLTVALLDAAKQDPAHRVRAEQVWATRRPVQRDYHWLGNTTVYGYAAARIGDRESAASLYRELAPFTGRVGGLDAGTLFVGMVDDALAELAELLDRPDDAQRHRAAAAETRVRLRAALESTGQA